jgi:regulatory protein
MAEQFVITGITVQNKKKSRYSIFINYEYAFDLDDAVLLKSGIARGDVLSPERVDQILELQENKRAKDKAIRLLAVRPRSRKEIMERLRQTKFPQSTIDWVVTELERLQLLNDTEFALSYCRSRLALRPAGSFVLRQELKNKGIAHDLIESSIQQAYKDISESEYAMALARKKKNQTSREDETKAKKRVVDFLMRRGFHWDIVSSVMEHWDQI